MNTDNKVIPNSLETENKVLTAIMIYEDAIHEIAHKLQPDAFYNIKNKLIYESALELFKSGKVTDMITLSQALTDKVSLLELSQLSGDYCSEDLVPQYVNSLIDYHTRRELIYLQGETNKAYSEANDVNELLSDVSNILDNIGSSKEDTTKAFSSIFTECMDQHDFAASNQGGLNGISSGYRSLNKLNNGWNEGELIVLAGRPAMGKTTLALNFILEAIKRDKKVAMFSMEMTTKELGQKLMSVMTGIETDRIKLGQCTPEELIRLQTECSPIINGDKLMVDDNGSMDIHKMKSIARKLKATNGLDMIVVDYLQLLNGNDKAIKGGSREQQISFLSRSLKALAKDLNIPIICLSQLSRALESREDKRPMLSDLRESGAIEQDANQVIFVYREAYYTKDDSNNITEVIVGKNRSGRCGVAQLEFDGAKSTFKEYVEENSMINY
tara:strand:- start:3547 stop:4872 length:1326 start_codon:yes stop_codon:yes gene_type:complete